MKKLMMLFLIVPVIIYAQVREDFSDGNITQDPAWSGDQAHFRLSTSSAVPADQRPALQLDAPGAGMSFLAAGGEFTGTLEWQCWIKLSLNTSAGNFSRFYLLTDSDNLTLPLNGYYLQAGGAEDSVLFCRQDSAEITELARLSSAFTGNTTNALRFRVTRTAEGHWKFFCDDAGGHSLSSQGEAYDLTYGSGSWCGLFCQYTSSNTTKFYFDDIYAGPLIIDTVPPDLLACNAVSPEEVFLTFSEAVDPNTAENELAYEVLPEIGHPVEAVRLLDPYRVYLFFDQELVSGTEYTLTISDIADPAGNSAGLITVPLMYYRIRPYDLVITEIMADPDPPRELPVYEYIEIYNRSTVELKTGGLQMTISSSEYQLPYVSISPGNYLIFCDDDALEIMQHVAPSAGLPSFGLPNTGAAIQLTDTTGSTVCWLQYDESWYGNDAKSEGGWSLEMIDTGNPCKGVENWAASAQSEGGTPGSPNSVSGPSPEGISIVSACCPADSVLEVVFNESLDSVSASDTSRYVVSPFIGHPDNVVPEGPGYNSVRLYFSHTFIPGEVYELEVDPGPVNCTGQPAASPLLKQFAVSQPVEPFDVIINEILFNPLGDGADYVEILNRSRKAIALADLLLVSVKSSPPAPPDTQSVALALSCETLLPSRYLALTSDPSIVKSQYYAADPDAFLELSSFPSYNNDEGRVLLMDRNGTVIDGMSYSEEMHFLLLNSFEGISLERISPDRSGSDPLNWHSAAETSGFGTPGYQNSQFLDISEAESAFSIQPEVFSPDGDGKDDNAGIVYHFSTAGKLMTVLIFTAEGKLARRLVNNEMPGTQGLYSWDGTLDDRTEAGNGIYVIYAEVTGMDGKTEHYKKSVVLARSR